MSAVTTCPGPLWVCKSARGCFCEMLMHVPRQLLVCGLHCWTSSYCLSSYFRPSWRVRCRLRCRRVVGVHNSQDHVQDRRGRRRGTNPPRLQYRGLKCSGRRVTRVAQLQLPVCVCQSASLVVHRDSLPVRSCFFNMACRAHCRGMSRLSACPSTVFLSA